MKFVPYPKFDLNIFQIESNTPINAVHTVASTDRRLKKSDGDKKPLIVLIRGLPGSGKSTLAEKFEKAGFRHFEADRFSIKDGDFLLDKSRLKEAHQWCRDIAMRSLDFGQRVVVSNTFARVEDILPYLKLTDQRIIIEAGGAWPNQHGVTDEQIKGMRKKWETL